MLTFWWQSSMNIHIDAGMWYLSNTLVSGLNAYNIQDSDWRDACYILTQWKSTALPTIKVILWESVASCVKVTPVQHNTPAARHGALLLQIAEMPFSPRHVKLRKTANNIQSLWKPIASSFRFTPTAAQCSNPAAVQARLHTYSNYSLPVNNCLPGMMSSQVILYTIMMIVVLKAI